MEAMRRELPPGAKMYIAKNRLLRVAVDNLDAEGQARWEGLKGQKGDNAWVFADEDSIQGAAKAFKTVRAPLISQQAVSLELTPCNLHPRARGRYLS